MAGPQQLSVLQAGRGIAAFVVVLFHANVILAAQQYGGQEAWSGFRAGHAGVSFFFVLSGFIIAHAHWRDIGDRHALWPYLWNRVTRIYPIYWIALALAVFPLFLIPSFGAEQSRSWGDIFLSAILWPTPQNPHLGVAWTLRHEMLFYLIFSLVVLNRSVGILALGVWFTCVLGWLLIGDGAFPFDFLLSTYNVLFLFGLAVAWAFRSRTIPAPALLVSVGLVGVILLGGLDVRHGLGESRWMTLGYGLSFAALIAGLVELERSRGLVADPALSFLGKASYSLYLIHYLVLSAGAKALDAVGASSLPVWSRFALLVVGAVVAGLCFYRAEAGLDKWLKARRPQRTARPLPA